MSESQEPEPTGAEESEPTRAEEPEPTRAEEPEPTRAEEPELTGAEEPEPTRAEGAAPEAAPEAEPKPELGPEPEPTVAMAPPAAPKRLVRSRDDRVIAGVCGGLGEYLGIDAVLLRIAALLLVFAGGAGLVLYVVGWIAMPEAPDTTDAEPAEPGATAPTPGRTRGTVLLGLVFIALGVLFLLDEIWPDFLSWQYVWPIALIAVGIAVLARARR